MFLELFGSRRREKRLAVNLELLSSKPTRATGLRLNLQRAETLRALANG